MKKKKKKKIPETVMDEGKRQRKRKEKGAQPRIGFLTVSTSSRTRKPDIWTQDSCADHNRVVPRKAGFHGARRERWTFLPLFSRRENAPRIAMCIRKAVILQQLWSAFTTQTLSMILD
ncbi:hypothetical protein PUN28_013009 [Cardiocondyla obscurior]|uniref:Uncharacterized protein n=1 Tax=Cardiocondyla obscurior TaxID=286306 RepID=A0AAW2FAH8_9HYME